MQGNSRTVTSNQNGVHPDLADVVRRHLTHPFQQPFKQMSRNVFEEMQRTVDSHGGPLILDSGCGTGESTLMLARRHPDSLVIGFDKSELRINKAGGMHETTTNAAWFRADAVDVWRLANQAGWRLQHHYLLYPNPWPKRRHLRRRWHAHPVFNDLLDLGGTIHLRSNWQIYINEFAFAIKIATGKEGVKQQVDDGMVISAFERKYRASGQVLLEYILES